MKSIASTAIALGLFVAGIGIGIAAPELAPSLYRDKPAPEAARELLDVALKQAGKGSWERIAVGRIHYLGGQKAQGQAIFDAILAGKHADSDEYRIARVYREAGEWNKAKPIFDRFLAANPEDEKGLAEVGAFYLLNGDRETAERLFDRSFKISDEEVWSSLSAAGAYLGVAPQE